MIREKIQKKPPDLFEKRAPWQDMLPICSCRESNQRAYNIAMQRATDARNLGLNNLADAAQAHAERHIGGVVRIEEPNDTGSDAFIRYLNSILNGFNPDR